MYTYFGQNNIERVTEPLFASNADEGIPDTVYMVLITWVVRDVTEVPIRHFRYTGFDEVVQIERNSAV